MNRCRLVIQIFITYFLFAISLLCVSAQQISFTDINKKFGINFLKDTSLWDDTGEEFKKRLGANFQDTEINGGKIYTSFAKGKVLTANIEQISFIERSGKVAQVDMVFFNKGDSADGKRWTPKLQREMKQQWDSIENTLNSFAGKSTNGFWGQGRIKNRAKIWKFQSFIFTLEFKPKEFITLHITNPQAKIGKISAASDFDGKVNIQTESNGDVWIKNIPMIDQGPKGYCVPATIERCLKYYAITDVDMHKIAAVCKTQIGGGTLMSNVMTDFKKICGTFKLKMTNVGSLSMNSISSMIDKGIPICWTMFSTEPYTKRMMENTQKRTSTNFEDYCDSIKKQDKLKRMQDGAHVCLIIGYNKKSKELAVSNSWGERFEISWVRFEDAKIVSRNLFVINPR